MGFFKAYDMRGTFGTDFDLDTVYRVGRALPQVVKGKRWLVGRDCRVTSAAVRNALVKGLSESGAEVTDLGLCTTPMVYYFTATDGFDGSVMITASHNPPSDNGLKVSMKTALPVGYANGLAEVEKLVVAESGSGRADDKVVAESGSGRADDKVVVESGSGSLAYRKRYVEFLKKKLTSTVPLPLSTTTIPLRIGIDCSNGMASLLAHEIFPDAVIINDTLDGTFPNHSPNPLKADAREQLAALVREQGLDCGIIFDGDADRAMFVDENGEFVQPDYLIPIIARNCIGEAESLPLQNKDVFDSSNCGGRDSSAPKVIHDVRTSRGAIETLKEHGFEPVMVPVGHAFAKPKMRETGAICGGELAGHYYFREFFGCDSAFLAAIRVLSEFARYRSSTSPSPSTFSSMMQPIVSRYANSGELNFKVEDKDAAIERVLASAAANLPREVSRSTMDGIRIEYEEGWINIRKSNTEPFLRLIVEAKTKPMLASWANLLKAAIEAD